MKKFKKASQALAAAKELIRPMKRWTQGSLAVKFIGKGDDRQTLACKTKAKKAEAFCALGAVKRINGPAERAATAFLRQAASAMQGDFALQSETDIFEINDEGEGSGRVAVARSHRRVLRMFDRAIKAAKAAGN